PDHRGRLRGAQPHAHDAEPLARHGLTRSAPCPDPAAAMPGSVPRTYRFADFGLIIDEVHALFDAWVEDDVFAGVIDEAGLLVMKLAVHEWIANLVQHAVFRHGAPVVLVTVATEDAGVRCRIEDNSDGFDFRSQVAQQEGAVFGPEPTER